MQRESGILMSIFSLPNKYGIGDFGKSSYKFIDFLRSANQRVWQILPLVQTGYGNSPYSSIASTSFSPYFISPEILMEEGLLTKEELETSINEEKYVDYGFLFSVRFSLLRKAFSRFDRENKEFNGFVKGKTYLDYALFMALKGKFNDKHFYEWKDKYKYRDKKALLEFEKENKEEILFWQFVQFKAKTQWQSVKKYANKNKIKIFGDLPLYVALDSVDVWCNPKLFKLNRKLTPKKVAGVPPDYFCSEGQLWGNPVYDYREHKKDNFKWWTNRIKTSLNNFDLIRVDHFRGLDRFYQVDFGKENAMEGEWVKVPSKALLKAIHEKVDKDRIIAEDLGIIDDGVRKLLNHAGYPGMKILSFAFNGEWNNPYLPKNIEENSVCFTGTHDNDTLLSLIQNQNEWERNNLYWGVKNSLMEQNIYGEVDGDYSLARSVIALGASSKAKLFILPMQDLLLKGGDYRINEPGVVKEQNWAIRFKENDFGEKEVNLLLSQNAKFNRNK